MNKYTLIHEHEYGYTGYNFISEKSFKELQDIIGGWGEQSIKDEDDFGPNPLGRLCDMLGIKFEESDCERLTLQEYDASLEFHDITGKL